jgi:hypothetical protein
MNFDELPTVRSNPVIFYAIGSEQSVRLRLPASPVLHASP